MERSPKHLADDDATDSTTLPGHLSAPALIAGGPFVATPAVDDPFSDSFEISGRQDASPLLVRLIHAQLVSSASAKQRLRDALVPLVGLASPHLSGILHVMEAELSQEDGAAPQLTFHRDITETSRLCVLEARPPGIRLRALLDDRRLREEPYSAEELRPMLKGILAAQRAVEAPWRHGCLLPSHIFVDQEADDHVSVTGAYLASALPAGPVAVTLQKVPNPSYFAPELRDGLPHRSSDLYTIGAIVFEALTGRLPHPGETPRRELGALGEAIGALLLAEPHERPDTLEQLAKCLNIDWPPGADPDTTEHDLRPSLDARTTQVDVNAVERFQLAAPDLKATQVDSSVPFEIARQHGLTDDDEALSSWDQTHEHELVPRVRFDDLDPSLVRLALGADPGSQDENVPTTPGQVASPNASKIVHGQETDADRQETPKKQAKEAPDPDTAATPRDESSEKTSGERGLQTPTQPLPPLQVPAHSRGTEATQAPVKEVASQPVDDAEETREQPQRPRRALAETMLDVRTGPSRRSRIFAFFAAIAMFAVVMFAVAAWIRDWRHRAAAEEEERRLERKLERLGNGSSEVLETTRSPAEERPTR